MLPLLAVLSACGDGGAPAIVPKAAPAAAADPAYLNPPVVTASRPQGGNLLLSGSAPPDARVRLATPEGQTLFAEVDAKGLWSLTLPASGEARIFGISAASGQRTIQGEGYLLLTPAGEAVILRAGAGALRIGRAGPSNLDAVDFDREGGAVVSGRAPAGAALAIHIDGRQIAEGRADAAGHYAVSMTQQPLTGGQHQIDVFGDATENPVTIDTSAAPPLSSGPFSAAAVAGGLRVDWITPGGGAQSTFLLK